VSDTEQAKRAKQHDLEETPREKAHRLVVGDMRRLTERYARLRERLYHHARYLGDEDKRELVSFLEGEFEQTRTILDGVGGVREFGFSSDLLDGIDG
jgi:hypothetical protein